MVSFGVWVLVLLQVPVPRRCWVQLQNVFWQCALGPGG